MSLYWRPEIQIMFSVLILSSNGVLNEMVKEETSL